jgi:hypothetical protein
MQADMELDVKGYCGLMFNLEEENEEQKTMNKHIFCSVMIPWARLS